MKLLATTAVLLLASSGCARDYCERSARNSERIKGGCEAVVPRMTEEQCEAAIENCGLVDKWRLGRFQDCLDDLAPCTKETEVRWILLYAACARPTENLSEECKRGASKPSQTAGSGASE